MVGLNLEKFGRDIESSLLEKVSKYFEDNYNRIGNNEAIIRKRFQEILRVEKKKYEKEMKDQEIEFKNVLKELQQRSTEEARRQVQKIWLQFRHREQKWISSNNNKVLDLVKEGKIENTALKGSMEVEVGAEIPRICEDSPSYKNLCAKFYDGGASDKVEIEIECVESQQTAADAITKCFGKEEISELRTKQKVKLLPQISQPEVRYQLNAEKTEKKSSYGFFSRNPNKV